jgi:predicted PurR-regulated permease PerM
MFKIIAGIVGALVVAILIVAAILIWVPTDFLQKASFLATVTVSFFACGLLIVTTGLVVAVLALVSVVTTLIDKKVNPLIDRVYPLLDKVNETADTAKGTVTYVGEGVVSPLIKVSSILAAVRGGISALLRSRNG